MRLALVDCKSRHRLEDTGHGGAVLHLAFQAEGLELQAQGFTVIPEDTSKASEQVQSVSDRQTVVGRFAGI
jgi:hypothetical protein